MPIDASRRCASTIGKKKPHMRGAHPIAKGIRQCHNHLPIKNPSLVLDVLRKAISKGNHKTQVGIGGKKSGYTRGKEWRVGAGELNLENTVKKRG